MAFLLPPQYSINLIGIEDMKSLEETSCRFYEMVRMGAHTAILVKLAASVRPFAAKLRDSAEWAVRWSLNDCFGTPPIPL
jgi:hypothetical protein